MLSPHRGVRGAMPKHTPVLVDAMVSLGCDVMMEPWGRHSDDASRSAKMIRRSLDIARIRRRLIEERFDTMIVKTSHETPSLLANVPLLAATRRHAPAIIVQFHGGRSDLLVAPGHRAFKSASAALFALSDGILVLSSEEARDARQFWPRGCFHVVANPFVRPAQDGIVEGRATRADDRQLSLLFVGRLIDDKGIFELLAAFAQVIQRHDCRLVIVGDGPASGALLARVGELGLDGKVTLTGFLAGDPLLDAYRDADLFVFPSYREGFPTAVTEAMAAGLPIVTTRTRGMADHLKEEENALLVSPRDAEGLAAALERIINDAALRARMSAANTSKVADFAPEPVARQYLETVNWIVQRKAASSVQSRGPR